MRSLAYDEQKLLIELSYNFVKIGIGEYVDKFFSAFYDIGTKVLNQKKNIIFAPLEDPYMKAIKINSDDEVALKITKSADFLYYLLSNSDYAWVDFSNKFIFRQKLPDIIKSFISKETLLVLIDDFVGSGETAIKSCGAVMERISKEKEICNSDVCIVSIGALEYGIRNVENILDVRVFSDIVEKKGISDYNFGAEKNAKLELMKVIELKLKCPVKYSLGYGKSEALFSFMNKSPNNTFPVFWHETKKKAAPFPRYKNYEYGVK